jgi:hypothetical protein
MIVLVLLVMLGLAVGCGGGSPETVVKNFTEALGRTRGEAKEYCTERGKGQLDTIEEGPIQVTIISFGKPEYKEGVPGFDPEGRKVCLIHTSTVWESENKEYTYRLVDDGSGWKVDEWGTGGIDF